MLAKIGNKKRTAAWRSNGYRRRSVENRRIGGMAGVWRIKRGLWRQAAAASRLRRRHQKRRGGGSAAAAMTRAASAPVKSGYQTRAGGAARRQRQANIHRLIGGESREESIEGNVSIVMAKSGERKYRHHQRIRRRRIGEENIQRRNGESGGSEVIR
jgi:hypothetical protein